MREINKENAQCFIDDDPMDYYKKPGTLWQMYFLSVAISVPTLLFGVFSDITKYFLPIVIILGIWLLYLTSDLDKKKVSCILFLCIFNSWMSIASITGAYKIILTIMEVQLISVATIIILNSVVLYLYIKKTLKRIQEGYYCTKERKVDMNMFAIGAVGYLLGAGIVRLAKGHISQNGGLMFVGAFLSLISLVGLLNAGDFWLKCLLIRKLSLDAQ